MIDCWRDDDEFSWNNYFHENIIVNVNFFVDLKFEYYWALPRNTDTSKPKIRNLNWWEGPWNIFWKNYWALKYLGLWFPGLRKTFSKNCKTLPLHSPPPSYMLNVRSLMILLHLNSIWKNAFHGKSCSHRPWWFSRAINIKY